MCNNVNINITSIGGGGCFLFRSQQIRVAYRLATLTRWHGGWSFSIQITYSRRSENIVATFSFVTTVISFKL